MRAHSTRFNPRRATLLTIVLVLVGYFYVSSSMQQPAEPPAVVLESRTHETRPQAPEKAQPATRPARAAVKTIDANTVTLTEINSCEADVYELHLLEGGEMKIARGLIKSLDKATFGKPGSRQQDCLGLLDAFVQDRGLYMDIAESVLGGHPAPKGENVLSLTFSCDETADSTLPTKLSDGDLQMVRRTLDDWRAKAPSVVPCAYKEDIRMQLPAECVPTNPSPDAREACFAKFYPAVMDYAMRVGTQPISHHDALKCMFSNALRNGNSFTLEEMQEFAKRTPAVWLVRIKDREVSWDELGGHATWKAELASWSLLQMALYVVKEALRRNPELLAGTPPVYLLINSLDNPKVGPWPDATHPDAEVSFLRSGHQADAVPSKAFVQDFTQWGTADTNLDPSGVRVPVLSWSSVPTFQKDILVPNRHTGSCHSFFFDPRISAVPFEQKKDAVLFRAFSAACDRSSKGPRQSLSCFAEDHGGSITLGGTAIELDIGGGRGWGPTGSTKYMSPARQAQYKYLLLLDGVVAAFRDVWLLQTGSVILATGVWKTVRTQLLKPWIHYIPFSSDLHDFQAVLEIVARNQTYAKWVANNALEASKIISGHATDGGLSYDIEYYDSVIKYYSELVTVDDSNDPVRWTQDTRCGEWLATTGRVRQCLPDTYACDPSRTPPPGQWKVNQNYFGGNG